MDLALSPESALERLRESMAIVRSLLLTPTWGKKESCVGRIEGSRVEMRVRHGSSNGLTRLFHGEVTPAAGGSRLAGEFRTLLWVVLILRAVWLALLAPMILVLAQLAPPGRSTPRAMLAAVGAPLVTLAFLLVIEVFARRMGDADERRMREHFDRLFADARGEPRR
jgi:hypothetical protein